MATEATAAEFNCDLPNYKACPKLLVGQKALVTGANSGIGEAVAIGLARAGADVIVNYVTNDAAAQNVVEAIEAEGVKGLAIEADVSKEVEVEDMFKKALEAFGTLDILVANAGLQRDSSLVEMTLSEWNTVLGINLTGQFLCIREAAKEFLRRGVRKEVSVAAGKIICMSSVHEVIPWSGHVNYASSKGGIYMMMKSSGAGAGAAPHPRQLDRAGRHPHADQHWRLEHARSLCRPDEAGPLQADRRARGYCQRRGVPRVGHGRLHQRCDDLRRRRHDLLPRLRHRRLRSAAARLGPAPRRASGRLEGLNATFHRRTARHAPSDRPVLPSARLQLESMVGVSGFEPPAPASRRRCSTRLSYTPNRPMPLIPSPPRQEQAAPHTAAAKALATLLTTFDDTPRRECRQESSNVVIFRRLSH